MWRLIRTLAIPQCLVNSNFASYSASERKIEAATEPAQVTLRPGFLGPPRRPWPRISLKSLWAFGFVAMFTALVLGTKRSLRPKRNNNDNSIHSPKTGWHGWTPLGKMSTTLTVLRRIQPLFNIFLVTGQFGLDAIAMSGSPQGLL